VSGALEIEQVKPEQVGTFMGIPVHVDSMTEPGCWYLMMGDVAQELFGDDKEHWVTNHYSWRKLARENINWRSGACAETKLTNQLMEALDKYREQFGGCY